MNSRYILYKNKELQYDCDVTVKQKLFEENFIAI